MASPDESVPQPLLEAFLDEPTRNLDDWAWLWEGDHRFPVASHRGGIVGKVVVAFKRLLGPLVRSPQADLWERQRVFNQILIAHLSDTKRSVERLADDTEMVGSDLQQVQQEILADLRSIQRDINGNVKGLSEELDDFRRKGLEDVMRHTDALFSRLDQKMDRVRRELRKIAGTPVRPDEGSRS